MDHVVFWLGLGFFLVGMGLNDLENWKPLRPKDVQIRDSGSWVHGWLMAIPMFSFFLIAGWGFRCKEWETIIWLAGLFLVLFRFRGFPYKVGLVVRESFSLRFAQPYKAEKAALGVCRLGIVLCFLILWGLYVPC